MKIYAVTSGKGGVGKTNISANLALAFAARGQRVVVFDADIGLANLDVVLGVRPEFTLQHALSGEQPLSQVISTGPGGVRFIAGGSGIDKLVSLSGARVDRFLDDIAQMESETDILIFDTGAGLDENVMTFIDAADEVLLVVTPDPSSITDGYATIKAVYGRRPEATVRVILNMVDSDTHGRNVYAKIYSIASQFLNKRPEYGGAVRFDAETIPFIRKRKPFLLGNQRLNASQDVLALATSLMGLPTRRAALTFADKLRYLFVPQRKAA